MEPPLAFAGVVAALTGLVPLLAASASLMRRVARFRLPVRAVAVVGLAVALRAAPASASVPPAAERLEQDAAAVDGAAEGRVAPPAPDQPPERYRVVPGDSLWAIACRHLLEANGARPGDAEIDRYWRLIYAANRDVVGDDPDLIFPGQQLVIPPEA